jgi:hypothetical protein
VVSQDEKIEHLKKTISHLRYKAWRRERPKKVPIPSKDEKPIMGLVSDTVENILAAPNLPVNKEKDMLKKRNFGKVPKYLQKI